MWQANLIWLIAREIRQRKINRSSDAGTKILIKNVLFASLATNRFICCLFSKQCLQYANKAFADQTPG